MFVSMSRESRELVVDVVGEHLEGAPDDGCGQVPQLIVRAWALSRAGVS